MPSRKGLLCLQVNMGLMFDLAAIRAANPGWRPVKFHAVLGNVYEPPKGSDAAAAESSKIGISVQIDGKQKFQRQRVRHADGPIPVEFKIDPSNSRLSVSAFVYKIDDPRSYRIVFGDPTLDLEEIPTK